MNQKLPLWLAILSALVYNYLWYRREGSSCLFAPLTAGSVHVQQLLRCLNCMSVSYAHYQMLQRANTRNTYLPLEYINVIDRQ